MSLNFKKLSVLVVEDIRPMRDLIVTVLESLGVGTIMTAPDGVKGFELFCARKPDIIITDWHMEPVNGIDMTRMVRTHPQSPDRMTPVILVTGYSALLRVAQARDAGVTEFVVKPFSANDIAKRIAHVINKPRDYIDSQAYFGPDRRRRKDGPMPPVGRRREDIEDEADDRENDPWEVG